MVDSHCLGCGIQWKDLYGDTPERLEVVTALLETRQAFVNVRSLLRHVGEAANVPVSLLDQFYMDGCS